MTDEGLGEQGAAIRARRERFGIDVSGLAELAGLSRTTVHAVEAGKPAKRGTLNKLNAALDRFEHQTSGPYDSAGQLVTFRLQGNFGVDVTVQGPVDDFEKLSAEVERLLEKMQTPGESG